MGKNINANKQLSLFPDEVFIKEKPQFDPYWEKFFNWVPQVGGITRVDQTIALCLDININRYCYGMKANILSIDGNVSIVEPTEEWINACRSSCYYKGQQWKVETYYLAPVLN